MPYASSFLLFCFLFISELHPVPHTHYWFLQRRVWPFLPSLQPTGGMLRTYHHVAAGCVSPGWSAFQVFLHDHPWWGSAYTRGWGEQGGQKQPSAPDLGGLAGFVLPSGLLSRCSLLCFTHNLVTYFQCCCQDPLPSPSWPFPPPTDSLFSGLCGFLNSPSSQKNGHQLYFLLCYLSPTSQISLAFISHSFLLCFKGCHRRQWGSPWTARLSLKAALSGWCQTGSVCGWARSQGWVLLGCTSGTAGHRAQHTSGAACTLPVPVQVLRQRFMGWWCSIGSTGMGLTFLSDYNSCCHWYPCPHSLFLVSSFLVLFHSHFDSCPQEQH